MQVNCLYPCLCRSTVFTLVCAGQLSLPLSVQVNCLYPCLCRSTVFTLVCAGQLSLPLSVQVNCLYPCLCRSTVFTLVCAGQLSLPLSVQVNCLVEYVRACTPCIGSTCILHTFYVQIVRYSLHKLCMMFTQN